MNNTEKLLRAFIEAQGFEIERIVNTKEVSIPRNSGLAVHHNLAVDNQGAYKRGDDECYYLKASMEVDYKVTKKPLIKDIIIGGLPLTQYITNIINHKECAEEFRFIRYSKEVVDAIVGSGFFSVAGEIDGGYLIEGVRVLYESN